MSPPACTLNRDRCRSGARETPGTPVGATTGIGALVTTIGVVLVPTPFPAASVTGRVDPVDLVGPQGLVGLEVPDPADRAARADPRVHGKPNKSQ